MATDTEQITSKRDDIHHQQTSRLKASSKPNSSNDDHTMVSMDAERTQSKDTIKQEGATENIKRPKKMRLDKPPHTTRRNPWDDAPHSTQKWERLGDNQSDPPLHIR
jgi:hypothetical protein